MSVPSDSPVVKSFAVVLLAYAALLLSVYVLRDVYAYVFSFIAMVVASVVYGIVVRRDAKAIENLGRARGVKAFKWYEPRGLWGFLVLVVLAMNTMTNVEGVLGTFAALIAWALLYMYARRRALRRLGLTG
ncbi:MAG: hypothetical protein LM564_05295 [Desulfurococcaceae archaeon]|nr:hypothetical protein [Desulfurococcaceae archaeon]